MWSLGDYEALWAALQVAVVMEEQHCEFIITDVKASSLLSASRQDCCCIFLAAGTNAAVRASKEIMNSAGIVCFFCFFSIIWSSKILPLERCHKITGRKSPWQPGDKMMMWSSLAGPSAGCHPPDPPVSPFTSLSPLFHNLPSSLSRVTQLTVVRTGCVIGNFKVSTALPFKWQPHPCHGRPCLHWSPPFAFRVTSKRWQACVCVCVCLRE